MLPVSAAVIIVNGSEVGIEGDGVVFGGMIDTQMGQTASYMARPLATSTPLTLRLVRLFNVGTAMGGSAAPSATGRIPPQRQPAVTEAVIGGVVLATANFGAYRLWRRLRTTRAERRRGDRAFARGGGAAPRRGFGQRG